MRDTVQQYVSQYFFAGLLFGLFLLIERSLNLPGFTLWLLVYMVSRKVSFKIIFLLGLVVDLASGRIVGISDIILSLILMINSYLGLRGLKAWLVALAAMCLFEYGYSGGLPSGFIVGTIFFAPVFIFGFKFGRLKL